MTTTTRAVPTGSVGSTRDPRTTWRLLAAVLLPIGPLGVAILRGLMPYWTSDGSEDMVAGIAAHPDRTETMLWVFFLAYPPLVLAPLVIGFVTRYAAPRLSTWGAGLTFLGFVGLGAVGSTDLQVHAMTQDGFNQSSIVQAYDAVAGHPVASVSVGLFVIGHIVGMILLGIAVAKSGLVPAWVGVAIAVSQPVHFVSAVVIPSRWLDVTLGWGLTTIGFAFVAAAIWRMSNDSWDRRPQTQDIGPA